MLIERSIAFAVFLSLVQLGQAQNGTPDSTRWRIGVSAQFGQLTWRDQHALGWDGDPLNLVSFYNDRVYSGAEWTRHDGGKDGSHALTQFGLVLQSRRADQIEVQVGWNNFRFDDLSRDHYFPPRVHSSYTTARLEYTRTTAKRWRALRPSFGVRYGIAVFFRTGMSHSDYEYYYSPGRYQEHIEGNGSAALLQPTVWCGYRSRRVLFGVQLHWNVLGYASGELYTNSYRRFYHEETFVDRTDTYSEWLGPDDLIREGLFLSDICIKLTLNLVGVGKRQAVPEPRPRKAARKDAVVQPSGR